MNQLKKLFRITIFMLTINSIHPETYSYYGDAFDIKTGIKLYSDYHEEFIAENRHEKSKIYYKDETGKIFAQKNITFSKNPNVPDFRLEDYRDGYIEGSELVGNKIKLFHRKNLNSPMEEKEFILPKNSAIDGGFDYFIKDHWDEVLKGDTLKFQFFSPSKFNHFPFTLKKIKLLEKNGKKSIQLKMDIDYFLIGNFLPSIYITYDVDSKRIIHYEGISNINDSEGKSHFVKIIYFTPIASE